MFYDKNVKNDEYLKYFGFEDNYIEDYKITSKIYNEPIYKINNSNSIEDFNIYMYEDYVEKVKMKHYKQQLKDKLDERNCFSYIYSLIC